MTSENYRYFCLDGAGRMHNSDWFYAESDELAVAKIEADHADMTSEIWQANRLVAKLAPKRRPT